MPAFDGGELFVEDVGGGVGLGLQPVVEWIDLVVGVAVDDPDEGSGARELCRQHHVEVDLAGLALDFDFEDAPEFDVAFGVAALSWVGGGVLNMRRSGLKKG
jgi:hypothetical protein